MKNLKKPCTAAETDGIENAGLKRYQQLAAAWRLATARKGEEPRSKRENIGAS